MVLRLEISVRYTNVFVFFFKLLLIVQCHKTSEGHNRQMKLYSENAESITKGFSQEFEQDFMKLFRLQGGRRVKANVV